MTDSNRLVAEFYYGKDNWTVANGFRAMSVQIDETKGYLVYDFEFDEKWDLLMPVVEKLYDVIDEHSKAFEGLTLFELGIAAPIDMVYEHAVEAIKWYNQNSAKIKIPND
jgi:hypothetical protein